MASVYRAEDQVLGRPVAVKLLHAGLTGDDTFLDRFRKEAHSVANLAHQNIVTVHDIGQDDEQYYIVMEFVDGRTLKQVIRQSVNGLPVNRALDLAIKICDGLGYAHRAGIVHCDVKPQNVLVRRDDRLKVTDFGIARAMTEATSHDGQVWGTPQYFSPEQAQGKQSTPASDVYAIGVILFEMLTGELPFTAESHTALAIKHINEPPPSIRELNPDVSDQLEDLIFKAMDKEPVQRFKTAGQFGRILSTYRRHGMVDDTGVTPVTPNPTDPYKPPIANRPRVPQTTPRTPLLPVNPSDATQIFTSPTAPRREPEYIPAQTDEVEPRPVNDEYLKEESADWLTIGLALAAVALILGLIPFAIYIARQFGAI